MDDKSIDASDMQWEDSTGYTDFLFQCMQQRVDIARHLRELNQSQAEAASSGETNALLSILGRKQSLLDGLLAIQEKMQSYRDDDPEQRVWVNAQKRQTCRAMADEGSQLLAETVRLEEALLQDVTAQRDAVAAQLQDGSEAISTRNAYAADDLLSQSVLDIGGV